MSVTGVKSILFFLSTLGVFRKATTQKAGIHRLAFSTSQEIVPSGATFEKRVIVPAFHQARQTKLG
jgi:hypothetical protein